MKRRKKHLASIGDTPPSCQNSAKRRRRRREHQEVTITSKSINCLILFSLSCLLVLLCEPANSFMLLKSNCLSNSPNCTCSWRSGKFVADCSVQNLTELPRNDYFDSLLESSATENQMSTLNRDIQMLNLSSNSIRHLASGEFSRKKFRNLQKLYLSSNKLASIAPSAFFKLTGLIELDLSDNLLAQLDYSAREQQTDTNVSSTSGFLKDLGQLRQLNLNLNQLERIDKFTFAPLVQLRQLYLSRNQIRLIDKQAFDGLHVLNILHLDGNKLSYLNGEFILKLPQLHALQLAGQPPNKWRCDCHLRKLVRLLLYKDGPQGALNAQQQSLSILQDAPRCFTRQRRRWPLGRVAAAGAGAQGQKSDEILRAAAETNEGSGPFGAVEDQDDNADDHDDRAGRGRHHRKLATPSDKSIRLADSIVRAGGDSHETLAGSLGTSGGGGGNISEFQQQDQRADDEQRPRQPEEADDQFGPDGRLWTNMRLADFECPPEPAIEYLWPAPAYSAQSTTLNDSGESDKQKSEQAAAAAANNGIISSTGSRSVTLTGQPLTVASGEPLELTCASELTDGLDIELTRIEWFQWPVGGDNKQQQPPAPPRLLWTSQARPARSGRNNNNNNNNGNLEMSPFPSHLATPGRGRREIMMKMMKYDSDQRADDDDDDQTDHDHHQRQQQHGQRELARAANSTAQGRANLMVMSEPPTGNEQHARQLAVIDYVTRANASAAGEEQTQSAGKRLVRLVHLIHHQQQQQPHRQADNGGRALFLCRISNALGQLDLWYPVEFAPGVGRGDDDHQARRLNKSASKQPVVGQLPAGLEAQLARELSLVQGALRNSTSGKSATSGISWPRDRAQTLLDLELSRLAEASHAPLFVPLHIMPRSLLAQRSWRQKSVAYGSAGESALPRSQISGGGGASLDRQPAGDPSQMTSGASLERSLTGGERPVRPATTLRQTSGGGGGGQPNESAANHQPQPQTFSAAATGGVDAAASSRVGVNQIQDEASQAGGVGAASSSASILQIAPSGTKISNGLSAAAAAAKPMGDYDDEDSEAASQPSPSPPPDKLHDIAMRLIGRFTSGEWRSLDAGEMDDEDQAASRRTGELSSSGRGYHRGRGGGGDEQRNGRKSIRELIADAWHREDTTRGRMLALYQVFVGQLSGPTKPGASSLLMLLVGILGGCLLTSILFLRLRCASQLAARGAGNARGQKVGDSGGDCAITTSSEQEEEDEEEEGDSEEHDGAERVWPPLPSQAPSGGQRASDGHRSSTSPPDCHRPPASGSSGSTVTSTTVGSQRMLVSSSSAVHQQQPRFSSLPRRPQMMMTMMQSSRTMADFLGHNQGGGACHLGLSTQANSGNYEHLMGGTGGGGGENATDDQFSPSTTVTTSDACPTTSAGELQHELYEHHEQLDPDCVELPLVGNLLHQQQQHYADHPLLGPQINKTCTLGRNVMVGSHRARFINQQGPCARGNTATLERKSRMNNTKRVSTFAGAGGQPARRSVTWLMSDDDKHGPCNELVNHRAEQQEGLWQLEEADGNTGQFLRDEQSCALTTGGGGGDGLAHHQTIYDCANDNGRVGCHRPDCEQIYEPTTSTRATANCAPKLSQQAVPHHQHLHHNQCYANGDGAAPPWDLQTHSRGGGSCGENSSSSLLLTRASANKQRQTTRLTSGEHEYYLASTRLTSARCHESATSESNDICLLPADGFCLPGVQEDQTVYSISSNLPAYRQQLPPPAVVANSGSAAREGVAYGSHQFNCQPPAGACSSLSPNVTSSASSSTSRQQQQQQQQQQARYGGQQSLVISGHNLTSQLDDALLLLQSSISQCN